MIKKHSGKSKHSDPLDKVLWEECNIIIIRIRIIY